MNHQPQAQPRRSIYYHYRVHDAAPPVPAPDLPVLVVGAGPIGLVTALGLAQQGVRCVLLESELQVSEGSRAIVFTRRSMEILQQAGVADAVVAKGLPWRCGNSFYRGQRVFRMEAPESADDRFAPLTNLQQQYVEQYLVETVERQPLIDLRWGHKVTRIVRNVADSGVTLEIATPQGGYEQAAQWAVAADGARSTLRALAGLKLEGAAYEGRFVIADIRVALPLPTERLAFFDPPWNRGNTVLMHREPDDIWRIDYRLPDDETPEDALAPAALKARIDAQLAMIGHAGAPWELDWCSVYSARALTLPETTCTAASPSSATRPTCCRSSVCVAPTPDCRTRRTWPGSWAWWPPAAPMRRCSQATAASAWPPRARSSTRPARARAS